jgi:adenylate cyclase
LTRAVRSRSRDEASVLVVEDLHWIDDASDAFLEELVEAVAGTRTLLVCT